MSASPDDTPASLAVVVPMYDEEAGAEACVRAVCGAIRGTGRAIGFVVVDDGSRDGTRAILERMRGEFPGLVVVGKPNGGYGSALVAGARAAADLGHSHALFMDSDLTNPPEHIARFLAPIDAGFDLVKGSRFVAGGGMEGVPEERARVSRWGNVVARALFRMGVSDCTNGFRAIRIAPFLAMDLRERGFAIIVEELAAAKRMGLRVAEVPTILRDRGAGLRPTAFAYKPSTFARYLRYALRAAATIRRISRA